MTRPQIELIDVVKTFSSAAGDFTALKHASAVIRQGEFVSVIGKSGSGKSTLVNMITGIDHPTSGKVMVGEVCVTDMRESERALWRGKHLGVVFQFFQMLPILSLLENVVLPMDFCNMYDPEEREVRALDLLHLVGLGNEVHSLPAAVSGGQLQCAAIARALANDPEVIVADEPTGNLDTKTAAQVMDLFDEMKRRGKTIVMVTHDRSLAQRATRTILISDGEMVDADIARTLPMLPYAHMQQLAGLWQEQALAHGQTLVLDGAFLMVRSGALHLETDDTHVTLQAGDCVGPEELRLLEKGNGKLINVSGEPVHLLTLSQADYARWIGAVPEAEQRLRGLAAQRREGR